MTGRGRLVGLGEARGRERRLRPRSVGGRRWWSVAAAGGGWQTPPASVSGRFSSPPGAHWDSASGLGEPAATRAGGRQARTAQMIEDSFLLLIPPPAPSRPQTPARLFSKLDPTSIYKCQTNPREPPPLAPAPARRQRGRGTSGVRGAGGCSTLPPRA